MSVSLYWRPIKDEKHYIGGGSNTWEGLRKVFGDPCVLAPADTARLRAMAAVVSFGSEDYKKLADLVEQFGYIEVISEY